MKNKLISEIKENLKLRSIDDLKEIYITNNTSLYSIDAFEAIKQILRDNNVNIPVQNPPLDIQADTQENTQLSDKYYNYKKTAYFGMIISFVPFIISLIIGPDNDFLGKGSGIVFKDILRILGSIIWLWGFYNYVKRKGYKGIYTLLGLFGFVGLLAMYLKEDKGEAREKTLLLKCKKCKTEIFTYNDSDEVINKFFICSVCGEKNVI